jgi:hypothetical protein
MFRRALFFPGNPVFPEFSRLSTFLQHLPFDPENISRSHEAVAGRHFEYMTKSRYSVLTEHFSVLL